MIKLSGKNRTLKNEDFSEFLDTDRYDKESVLDCCDIGYKLGYRTGNMNETSEKK